MSNQLTESRPTSGDGSAACKICTWVLVQESADEVTERCMHCGQRRTRPKAQITENKGGRRILLEG